MSRLLSFLVPFVLGAIITAVVGFKMLPGLMISETLSPLPFEETLAKIESNAKEAGWKVPKQWKVNFQANFKKLEGVDIGPLKLLKMCEVPAAISILKHDKYKSLSVMMPCTVAVYQKSDGKVYIGTMNMGLLGKIFGGEVAKAIDRIAPQMDSMIAL